MVIRSSHLRKINHRHDAPPDSYLFYDLNNGIYYVPIKHYRDFTLEWINVSSPPALTCDLPTACTHAVILDFDHYPQLGTNLSRRILNIIECVLKMALIPTVVPHFTYIVTSRPHSLGCHIHLPELHIDHDNYILLCEFLQFQLKQYLKGNDNYQLDILLNAMLPGAAKPNLKPYAPLRLVYVDEHVTSQINMITFSGEYASVKKHFPKNRHNETSLFRSLLKLSSHKDFLHELKHLMMPVIPSRVDAPTHLLHFPTTLGTLPTTASDWHDVATFTYKKNKEPGYLSKCQRLSAKPDGLMRVCHFLKMNASALLDFETTNHALKRWYEQYGPHSHPASLDVSHIPPLFRPVHELLQFEHATLTQNPNPIKTIMQFREGYYFLPIFYAFCQHFALDTVQMAEALRPVLDTAFHPLLDRLAAVPPQNIGFAIADMSLHTVHFCANNLEPKRPRTNRDKMYSIITSNRHALLAVSTADQLVELVRALQHRHFPIFVLKLKNALKRPSRYVWNTLAETWQELPTDNEVTHHLQNLWSYVKQFYNEYRKSGGQGGPSPDLLKKFNVATLVSAILSDSTMERRDIQMDAHKWLLRLQDGVLDVLTGHVGGVVPEFFLSDRRLHLDIPRTRLSTLCNDSPALERLYTTLVDKAFFLRYLQALFLDRSETLFGALVHTLEASMPEVRDLAATDAVGGSMLHFYVNLCKCCSFEYELILYLMDVLASVYIGTNYERKFFVWKGLTRNGKSKLFELMGRVLGGYYHSITSSNLRPGASSSGNATPELASTLFACRMVTSEELEKQLDENRVKQITGNSFVSFRNLYEQNAGGIPTAKVFVTTNNYPECKASEAFKDRVVAFPFDAEFVDQAPATTSAQVERNTYPKEVYVVEQSYQGGFFLLYYHLKRHMSPEDGLLHYRPPPSCVVEFTEDYLIHADIYVQFKLYMDVQWKPGHQTTMNEVKSAVRQYLKVTKNTGFHEADLYIRFEQEFGELKQTDLKLPAYEGYGGYVSAAVAAVGEEEGGGGSEGPAPKRAKGAAADTSDSLVFYDGVVIKNLRRTNLDD